MSNATFFYKLAKCGAAGRQLNKDHTRQWVCKQCPFRLLSHIYFFTSRWWVSQLEGLWWTPRLRWTSFLVLIWRAFQIGTAPNTQSRTVFRAPTHSSEERCALRYSSVITSLCLKSILNQNSYQIFMLFSFLPRMDREGQWFSFSTHDYSEYLQYLLLP